MKSARSKTNYNNLSRWLEKYKSNLLVSELILLLISHSLIIITLFSKLITYSKIADYITYDNKGKSTQTNYPAKSKFESVNVNKIKLLLAVRDSLNQHNPSELASEPERKYRKLVQAKADSIDNFKYLLDSTENTIKSIKQYKLSDNVELSENVNDSLTFRKNLIELKSLKDSVNKYNIVIGNLERSAVNISIKDGIIDKPAKKKSTIQKLDVNARNRKLNNIYNDALEYTSRLEFDSLMTMSDNYMVTLTIALKSDTNKLKEIIATQAQLFTNEPISRENVFRASKKITARITGKGFEVDTTKSTEQRYSDKPLQWSWEVKPVKDGRQFLTLVVSCLRREANDVFPYELVRRIEKVEVQMTFMDKAKHYAELIAPIEAIATGIAGLFVTLGLSSLWRRLTRNRQRPEDTIQTPTPQVNINPSPTE